MESNSECLIQGSVEWLQARLAHVTASRIADVLTEPRSKADKEAGVLSQTAESYMLELIGEYLTGCQSSDFESVAMKWGTQWEPEARDVYADTMECDVDQAGFVRHPTIPRVGCSPDGLVGSDGLLEIKCPFTSREHVRTAMSQAVPDQYVAQVQSQLWITGRSWLHFVSYDPRVKDTGLRLIVVPVERDEEYIEKMESSVRKFVRTMLEAIENLNGRCA
jgi:putative phage-type endonuclease